jgi:ABC-2 type transport system ATP-binding protein
MSSVIETESLCKSFRGRRVVDRLSISVPRGAIFALLGDNGAGKSTTIRMLTGLLSPDDGRATILGEDCWTRAAALRHRVGYVPEKPRFYDWMTVGDIGWFTAGFHRTGYLHRFHTSATDFGLPLDAKLKTLSKGAYAKVGLSLALAADPEVLILDEPTSGLDLFTRREFLSSMVDLAGGGRTILISSHGVAEIERVASHVAFVARGRLLLSGTIEDLRGRLLRVRFRCQGAPPDVANLGTILDRSITGPQWQAVIQDVDRIALDGLAHRDGVYDYEESPLSLEEMYTALLGRYHATPPGEANGVNGSASPASRAPVAEGRQ